MAYFILVNILFVIIIVTIDPAKQIIKHLLFLGVKENIPHICHTSLLVAYHT